MTLLDDGSPVIVGAACDAIGTIGRLNSLPIDESNKSSLVKKLLNISFNTATPSKVNVGIARVLSIVFITAECISGS